MKGHIRERSPGRWAHRHRRARPDNWPTQAQMAQLQGHEAGSSGKSRVNRPSGEGDLCRAVQEVLTMVSASQQTQAVTVDRTNRAASIAYRRGGRLAFSEFGGQSSKSKASVTIKATLERAAILAIGKDIRAMLQEAENDQTGEQDL